MGYPHHKNHYLTDEHNILVSKGINRFTLKQTLRKKKNVIKC